MNSPRTGIDGRRGEGEAAASSLLDGRVVIVTGGGRGIGREHCLELARRGAAVAIVDAGLGLGGEGGDGDPAQEVAELIEDGGAESLVITASVTDWSAMQQAVAKTVERFGRLDAVVNNAGFIRDQLIVSSSEEDFDAVVAVHLKGTFNVTKHACDYWRAEHKRGQAVSGRIINTTSGAGLFGNVGQAAYAAAKGAIASLTMVTALEMERYNVTANAVSPVSITRMSAKMAAFAGQADSVTDSAYHALHPRTSSPLVAYLASAASGWLTGQVLRVEGNRVIRVRPWTLDESCQTSTTEDYLDAARLDRPLKRLYGITALGLG